MLIFVPMRDLRDFAFLLVTEPREAVFLLFP